jgi:hypothetical protein
MGKVIGKLALIAAVIALQFIPGVGQAVGFGLASIGVSVGTGLAVAGALTTLAIGAGLSLVSDAFGSHSKASVAQLSALNLSFDPNTPRKLTFGTGLLSTDVLYWEPSGTNQEYADYIIGLAAHEIAGVDTIYTESNVLWTAAGGVQGIYVGYATIDIRLVGTSSNGIAINSGATWDATCTLTGCAYIHVRIKRTGASAKADSPFSGGLPSRMTIVGRGLKLYDPRQDSTNGGSGSMRPNDQTTWTFTGIGDNHALQALTFLLGHKIGGKVSVGVGLPAARLDMGEWITAANICDESVTVSSGGTQARYSGGGIFGDADAPAAVLASLCTHMNAELRDVTGKLGVRIAHNDLSGALTAFTADDIIGSYERGYGPALNDTFNALRGSITDPSTAALYQPAPWGSVKIVSVDGINRHSTLDLALCHDAERAQRIATQVLIREQYQDTFTADFGPRMWAKRTGDAITLTFAPCGFVTQKFRIVSMKNEVVLTDGEAQQFCAVTLRIDDPAVYVWTAGLAVLPAAAVPVVAYNPRNNPLATVQGIDIGVDNGATRNVVTYSATAPASPANGDLWVDTSGTYAIFKLRSGGSWQTGATALSAYNSLSGRPVALSDINTTESAKLAGIATGADVTSANVPSLSVPTGLSVNYDYTGTIVAGQLLTLQGVRQYGNSNVSSTTTWSVSGDGCTVTVDAYGLATISALARTGFILWTSTRDGVTLTATTVVLKNVAIPPSAGGAGGGTSAYATSYSSPTTSSYGGSGSSVLTVNTGSSGQIAFSAPLSYTGTGSARGKWQWRAIGGTFADVAAEISAAGTAFAGEPDSIDVSQTKSGLTASTAYEVQLILRRSSGTGALNFSGNATAFGT